MLGRQTRARALTSALACAALVATAGPLDVRAAAPVADSPESRRPVAVGERTPIAAPRIVVSTTSRMLYLIDGRDTVFAAPIAIGMGQDFEFNGRKYHFATPTGRRTVIGKSPDPVWTPPDWHYYEKAARRSLEAVHMPEDAKVQLSDGTFLVVKDGEVGRINRFGYFSAFTPGNEIIFDGRIYIPPFSTPQRRVPDALGPFKLDMGDGYLIHGTHVYNEESIGQAVSHGCVRMNNDDLTRLYELVPVGTVVEIV
jgi:lipoprotein-anchoring transpeptidase ErfK/SrfK